MTTIEALVWLSQHCGTIEFSRDLTVRALALNVTAFIQDESGMVSLCHAGKHIADQELFDTERRGTVIPYHVCDCTSQIVRLAESHQPPASSRD